MEAIDPPEVARVRRVAVLGGGAAGFFCAINAARLLGPSGHVELFEQSSHFLRKVKISGGGRCNVTHACFDVARLSRNYPRGERELRGAFHRFSPADTVAWFAERGVSLKKEEDGRMFPVTDSSRTIVDCLLGEAQKTGVRLRRQTPVQAIKHEGGVFHLQLRTGPPEIFDRVVVATGGSKDLSFLESLDIPRVPPVPSLFSFHLPEAHWLRTLPGLTLPGVRLELPGTRFSTEGPLLVTHEGISGPSVLKLSAWAARELAARAYEFSLTAQWSLAFDEHKLRAWIAEQRREAPARKPANTPLPGLPLRFWEALLTQPDGLPEDVRWTTFSREHSRWMVQVLTGSDLPIIGKSLHKEEFVTCGGVDRRAINLHRMESRTYPGLHFAGEVLDIDGVTGGFNFQAAWTTAWIAAEALAVP